MTTTTITETQANPRLRLNRSDLLAVLLIVAAYALALALMPIKRDFALIDDWTYVHSVEQVMSGHGFRPSEYAQATLLTHTYWGALFAWLFGAGFTALTAATMFMSAVAALAFYAILRCIGFGVGLSGLGVALLVLNPYFLNLSYTFMTEITFLALLLLSSLFFLMGLQGRGEAWLWLGGAFATLTFLTRQFGLAVPVAAFLWLLYARRLTLSRALAVLSLPLAAAVGYYAWSSQFPVTFSGSVGREEIRQLRSPTAWVNRAAHFVYLELSLPGLLVPLWGKVRQWKVIATLAAAAAVAVFALWQIKLDQVEQGQSSLNELSVYWLQPLISNPVLIFCVGAALSVWLFGGLIERGWPGLVALVRRRREPEPSDFLYLTGIILFAGTYLISSGFLDRYWLPVLPFIIIGALSWARGRSLLQLAPALVVLAFVAGFGILVRLDQYDYAEAQWQAGRWVVNQGVPYDKIENGYAWDGYFLHDEPVKRFGEGNLDIDKIGRVFPPTLVIDPEYLIDTSIRQGYHVVKTFSYFSRLDGGITHPLFAMKRG